MLRKRSTYLVAGAILIAFVAGFMIGSYLSEPPETIIPKEYFDQMALYTWKGWSGDLHFLLIPMIDAARARHDFWSKWNGQTGVENLKKALSAVPKNKSVAWYNWPPKFQYPSGQFCDEIIAFAKSQGVQLDLNPASDSEIFTAWQPH